MGKGSSSGLSSALAGGVDTIVARATPAGRGALAIVRLSGPDVEAICATVCRIDDQLKPWRASLVDVCDRRGEALERSIALFYRAPRSFTGEDMAEFVMHGSPYLVQEFVRSCIGAGAREADPGEFTKRAVANGKMDLIQAEAIRDFIDSDTEMQARNARRQLSGLLSRRIFTVRDEIVHLLALLEADLDFSEHEVGVEGDRLAEARDSVLAKINDLLRTERAGTTIRDGLRVVIAGRPNAGKSTLFNRLVERERSIVSAHPGTTRDVVEAEIDVAGVPVVLVDTAGLHAASGSVEAEGVRRAAAETAEADAVLLVRSADDESGTDPKIDDEVSTLRVLTKSDLLRNREGASGGDWIVVSAMTGEGMGEVRAAMQHLVVGDVADLGGRVAIARRHAAALERAAGFLDCDLGEAELAAESVRWAVKSVESIIGAVDDEEILDEVFSGFCIGK